MGRESSRSRKRKFQGNQFKEKRGKQNQDGASVKNVENAQSERRRSASARKIGTQKPKQSKFTRRHGKRTNISGYRLIDVDILAELFEKMPCRECFQTDLVFSEERLKRSGLASHLRVFCKSCGWKHVFFTSRKVSRFFEVNRRFIYAMRLIGKGETAAKRFCGIMNMPQPPHNKAYDRHIKALSKSAEIVAEKTAEAADEIRNMKEKNNAELIQCGVSCDGTWQRRGHSSLNGCVTAISMDTGKCLDLEIMSKNCPACKKQAGKDTKDYRLWKADHDISGKCKANYSGSSPAMETAGVKKMFIRSEQKRSLLYSEYYGDGDSKGYNEVKNVYLDKGINVVKKECVGHVQKRVGTALRKLKREKKGMGGKGKLTNSMMDRLQNYYGIAIRDNVGNMKAMKKAIHASLMHCASSKDRDLHQHCPDGGDSWCKFKRDKFNKPDTPTYKPGPGLPLEVIAEVKPIYVRLSGDELLERCLDGKTQNQNESLNEMIWERLPKGVYVGQDTLTLGANDAVSHFNIGSMAATDMLEMQGIEPGKCCVEAMAKADLLRISKAEYKAEDNNKLRRKHLRAAKKKKDDTAEATEGVMYAAGEF